MGCGFTRSCFREHLEPECPSALVCAGNRYAINISAVGLSLTECSSFPRSRLRHVRPATIPPEDKPAFFLDGGTQQWRYSGNVGATGDWWAATEDEQMVTNDERFGGKHFINWKPYDHPDLGSVDIGGWIQFSVRNPPADIMEEEMLIPNMKFILYHASTTPLIRVRDLEVTRVEGVHRIDATISNEGLAPSYVTIQALRSKGIGSGPVAKPVVTKIRTGPGVTLVSGKDRIELGHIEGTPPAVKQYSFGSQTFGGNNQKKVEWFVIGSGEVTVEAVSEKGGKHSKTVKVGR